MPTKPQDPPSSPCFYEGCSRITFSVVAGIPVCALHRGRALDALRKSPPASQVGAVVGDWNGGQWVWTNVDGTPFVANKPALVSCSACGQSVSVTRYRSGHQFCVPCAESLDEQAREIARHKNAEIILKMREKAERERVRAEMPDVEIKSRKIRLP